MNLNRGAVTVALIVVAAVGWSAVFTVHQTQRALVAQAISMEDSEEGSR